MAKKDISTIIAKGSTKQRLSIVAECIARESYHETNKEPFITDAEFKTLSDSFKTPAEIKLWNKHRRYSEAVKIALNNLQGLLFELRMHYSDLRGYILVWNTIEASELISNSILHQLPKEQRLEVTNNLEGELKMFFTNITPDSEGYLEYKVDFLTDIYRDENGKPIGFKEEPRKTREQTLLYAMENVKKYAEDTATKFFSWRQALIDFMEETGFNPETFKIIIKRFTEEANKPVIGWFKYLSNMPNFNVESPYLDKFKFIYNITPNLSNIEIDEDEYNWFKNTLTDEE